MTQLITPKKKKKEDIYLFSIYHIVKIVQITFIDTLICKCFVVQLIEILAFQYIYETYLTWSHKMDVSIFNHKCYNI